MGNWTGQAAARHLILPLDLGLTAGDQVAGLGVAILELVLVLEMLQSS